MLEGNAVLAALAARAAVAGFPSRDTRRRPRFTPTSSSAAA